MDTEMTITQLVENLVAGTVSSHDIQDTVDTAVSQYVHRKVQTEIDKAITEQVGRVIRESIDGFMLGNEVVINNGFDREKRYPNLETLFKEKLHDALSKNYDIKRELSRTIENHIAKLMKEKERELVRILAEGLLEPKAA